MHASLIRNHKEGNTFQAYKVHCQKVANVGVRTQPSKRRWVVSLLAVNCFFSCLILCQAKCSTLPWCPMFFQVFSSVRFNNTFHKSVLYPVFEIALRTLIWQYPRWKTGYPVAMASSQVSTCMCKGSPLTPFWVLKSVERHWTASVTLAGLSKGFQYTAKALWDTSSMGRTRPAPKV